MSEKPTCPDCGRGITLVYTGAVVIDTEEGIVTNGGVTGGEPLEWYCLPCGGEERQDRVSEYGADLVYWLAVNYPRAEEALDGGNDWKLRR